MSNELIKSGDEIVKEFFAKVKEDAKLDKETREALFQFFQEGNFKRAPIKKKFESLRDSALRENNDKVKEDND